MRLERKVTHVGAGFVPNPRSRDRQMAIIHAAIEVLNEKGFEKASFEGVGRRCRMRRSHVAYYFRSKADLLETVYRYIAQTAQGIVVEEISRCSTPREKILGLVRGNFRWAEEHPSQVLLMMLFYFQAIRDERFLEVHQSIRRTGAERIQAVIRQGMKVSPRRAERLAKAVQSLITGGIIDYFTTGRSGPLSKARDATCEAVAALWKSYSVNPSRKRP